MGSKDKRDENGNILKYKVRLVARGFQQTEGVDYFETFAQTARLESFKLLLAISNIRNLRIKQYDISNAYLYSSLEEEVYVPHPPGFPGPPGTCLRLRKGLYGLKQSGKLWADLLKETLRGFGFVTLHSDISAYFCPSPFTLLVVHVDDLVLATGHDAFRAHLEKYLKEKFKVGHSE